MEELRDDKIGEILTKFQSYIRAKFAKEKFQKIVNERDGALVVQANWRAYMNLKVGHIHLTKNISSHTGGVSYYLPWRVVSMKNI